MNNLENKLNKAIEGWNYLWNLLEKEAKRDKVKAGILAVFYRYQVELDATKYKLENIENKIKKLELSDEDKEIIDDALSMHISNFQAIALTVENMLRD